MWRDYLKGYIKNNRSSTVSILTASLIATLLLSLLCTLFYNVWRYDVDGIILEEGDWQGRICAKLTDEDLLVMRNFANVESVLVNSKLSEKDMTVVDLKFVNARTIFEDIPLLLKQLGLEEEAASYHILLLSKYFIHDPNDDTPPLLMTYYLIVLIVVSISLILIIHNSFAVTMNARIRQFGIFSSIGATPWQIRICLMQEAAVLCVVPILLGSLLGILCGFGILQLSNKLAFDVANRVEAVFYYHPLVFAVTIFASIFTVFFSAWIPARKLSKTTPLEAIRGTNEILLKRKRSSRFLSLVFGMEGELAGNALKAQKKALRTSTLSLTLSFLGFTVMLCFFTLSGISTRYTYFERYQNAWDIMVTLKDTKIEDFSLTEELGKLEDVKDCVVYQKAEAVSFISGGEISEEVAALGGPAKIADADTVEDGVWRIKAPIVLLDDDAFCGYCEQIGISPKLDGAIIFNRIWDSKNSNFRYPSYIPYIREDGNKISLQKKKGESNAVEIPVAAYTKESPILREEYDGRALTMFLPLSLWNRVSEQIGGAKEDTYIRILAEKREDLEVLERLEKAVLELIGTKYNAEVENRILDKLANDKMIFGFKLILGGFCWLLAMIGIANVFSNTLGFLRQRKKEFARYLSIGMTAKSMRKMFCIEAFVIAGRPVFLTLPLTAAVVAVMIRASYLNPMEFLVEAPILPILIFVLAIFGFVSLAYYLGGRRVLRCSLTELLRDDTIL